MLWRDVTALDKRARREGENFRLITRNWSCAHGGASSEFYSCFALYVYVRPAVRAGGEGWEGSVEHRDSRFHFSQINSNRYAHRLNVFTLSCSAVLFHPSFCPVRRRAPLQGWSFYPVREGRGGSINKWMNSLKPLVLFYIHLLICRSIVMNLNGKYPKMRAFFSFLLCYF